MHSHQLVCHAFGTPPSRKKRGVVEDGLSFPRPRRNMGALLPDEPYNPGISEMGRAGVWE